MRHVHLSHGPALYEHAASAEVRHLVCEVCDRHVAVPCRGVRRRPGAPRVGVRLRPRRLALRDRRALRRPRLNATGPTARGAGAERRSASGSQFGLICDRLALSVPRRKGSRHAGDAHPGRFHRRPGVVDRRCRGRRRGRGVPADDGPGRSTSGRCPSSGSSPRSCSPRRCSTSPSPTARAGTCSAAVLAAVLVGPAAGALAVTVVLVVQALLFADGGLSALGLNVVNMALVGAFGGYGGVPRLRRLLGRSSRGVTLAAGDRRVQGAPVMAAVVFMVEYALGGNDAVSVGSVAAAMIGVHVLIGIGEGIITALAVGSVMAMRPDLVYGARELARGAGPHGAGSGGGLTWPAVASRSLRSSPSGWPWRWCSSCSWRRAPARTPTGSRRSLPTRASTGACGRMPLGDSPFADYGVHGRGARRRWAPPSPASSGSP